MSKPPWDAVEALLETLRCTEPTKKDPLRDLQRLLDALALTVHTLDNPPDIEDHPDPPTSYYEECRANVVRRFPSLGYYNVPLNITQSLTEPELGLADAVDDLADIAADLESAIWRRDNNGEADGISHLDLTFRTHWGMHLRGLQLFLHAHATNS